MIIVNDRVRFIDKEKDKKYGVLLVFAIKGDIATLGSGDYATLGQKMCNVSLSEIKKAE
jgi:hypothetical protein